MTHEMLYFNQNQLKEMVKIIGGMFWFIHRKYEINDFKFACINWQICATINISYITNDIPISINSIQTNLWCLAPWEVYFIYFY